MSLRNLTGFKSLWAASSPQGWAARTAIFACLLSIQATIVPESAATTPDHLEPGKQGESLPADGGVLARPYSKGVNVVGHSEIGGRHSNLIMAWAGHCAYVANGLRVQPSGMIEKDAAGPTSGVAVIDVAKPSAPKVVSYLQDKGAIDAAETLHAVVAPGRSVLAASTYGGASGLPGSPKEGWLSIYDVSDCAHPRLMAEVQWPEPVHTLTLSANGKRIYGTVLQPFTGDGGLQVMDITDLSKPRFVGRLPVTRADGTSYAFAPHEVSISSDERRIYAGVNASRGNDLNVGIKTFPPSKEALGPDGGGIYILDNSDIVAGRTDPRLRLVGVLPHGGWHSVVQANIGGVPHLVGAGELGACPGSWPKITDVFDETRPKIVGEFRLAMNFKENCPPPSDLEKASGGIVGSAGTASSHFNDVDSATDTRVGLFPMMWAGLRIADLRNPAKPEEVAYFKPGDPCMSHVRYVAETGHIWFACQDSGFWVIELNTKVRTALRKARGSRPKADIRQELEGSTGHD